MQESLDAVVQKLALYVQPENSADLGIFSNVAIANRFVPGKYELEIDRTKKRWNLALKGGTFSDSGSVGDMLVLRIGKTDRRMASAKLELVDRLPVRVLGAVLNGVELRGVRVLQVLRGVWGYRRNEYGAGSLSLVHQMAYFA